MSTLFSGFLMRADVVLRGAGLPDGPGEPYGPRDHGLPEEPGWPDGSLMGGWSEGPAMP